MKKDMLRNPIERENATNPVGNVMEELNEFEMEQYVAGTGVEPLNSGGVFCTATGECNFGTLNPFCC